MEMNLKLLMSCYLGDVIEQAGGCTDAVTTPIRSAWKALHELLPVFSRYITLKLWKSVSEVCFCMVVKLGPCQKEICQVLKLVAMQ